MLLMGLGPRPLLATPHPSTLPFIQFGTLPHHGITQILGGFSLISYKPSEKVFPNTHSFHGNCKARQIDKDKAIAAIIIKSLLSTAKKQAYDSKVQLIWNLAQLRKSVTPVHGQPMQEDCMFAVSLYVNSSQPG